MVRGISEINLNEENPRFISEYDMGKLIDSILSFPKMLEIRPVVVRGNKIIGGNQRYKALVTISKYTIEDIDERLFENYKYQRLSQDEQDELLSYWEAWLENPTVVVKEADDFNDREEKDFIIKDNLYYGEDDYSILRENYDINEVESYTGEINQLAYSFDDSINDEGIEETGDDIEKLKCGYIVSILSEEELDWLNKKYDEYIDKLEFFTREVLLCK